MFNLSLCVTKFSFPSSFSESVSPSTGQYKILQSCDFDSIALIFCEKNEMNEKLLSNHLDQSSIIYRLSSILFKPGKEGQSFNSIVAQWILSNKEHNPRVSRTLVERGEVHVANIHIAITTTPQFQLEHRLRRHRYRSLPPFHSTFDRLSVKRACLLSCA